MALGEVQSTTNGVSPISSNLCYAFNSIQILYILSLIKIVQCFKKVSKLSQIHKYCQCSLPVGTKGCVSSWLSSAVAYQTDLVASWIRYMQSQTHQWFIIRDDKIKNKEKNKEEDSWGAIAKFGYAGLVSEMFYEILKTNHMNRRQCRHTHIDPELWQTV